MKNLQRRKKNKVLENQVKRVKSMINEECRPQCNDEDGFIQIRRKSRLLNKNDTNTPIEQNDSGLNSTSIVKLDKMIKKCHDYSVQEYAKSPSKNLAEDLNNKLMLSKIYNMKKDTGLSTFSVVCDLSCQARIQNYPRTKSNTNLYQSRKSVYDISPVLGRHRSTKIVPNQFKPSFKAKSGGISQLKTKII